MPFDWIATALLAAVLLLTLWLALRPSGAADAARSAERLERELRDEVARSALGTRQELAAALATFRQALLAQQGETARTQNEQIDGFRVQLATTQQLLADTLRQATAALTAQAHGSREAQDATLGRFGNQQADALSRLAAQQADTLTRLGEQQALGLQRLSDTLVDQLRAVVTTSDQRFGEMRGAVENKLAALQQGNEQKLEQMRATVDEKLHATLEQRLGDSFKQVADRLEQVHRGLGEMQVLAKDVGSLNRVLSNVKTRGIFGEVQLAGLLEQVFTREQYGVNVETVPGSGARVEFAIRLPGRGGGGGDAPLWLPIDAKFPRDDYERLLEAQERADAPAVEAAGRAIERRLRDEARTIRQKYLAPPHTTDFAILFVPTEGLYAEALRRPGLMEALQREHRVTLAGPTTLLASLTSLQMGFRTLALERRSTEVWEVLGAVKTEFAKFGGVLEKTKKKLDEASSQIDAAHVRSRAMTRALRSVEALPDERAQALLPAAVDEALSAGADDAGAAGVVVVEPGAAPLAVRATVLEIAGLFDTADDERR